MKRLSVVFGCILFFALSFFFGSAQAAQVTLAWDLNSEVVTGYKVYWGTASRNYPNSVDVGNSDHITITGIDPLSGTVYFAATAYLIEGNSTTESDYSDEVSHAFVTTSLIISDGTTLSGWTKTGGSGNAIVDVADGWLVFASSSATAITAYKISLAGADIGENNISWQSVWLQNLNSFFVVRIGTTAGDRYLYYRPVDTNALGASTNVQFGIGSGVKDGLWHTFTRNLQADLKTAQPSNNLSNLKEFYVYVYGLGNSLVFDDLVVFATEE